MMGGTDDQGPIRMWWGMIALWIWYMWPNNAKRTQERLAILEKQLQAYQKQARTDAQRDRRLRSLEKTTSLMHLYFREAREADKKRKDPTDVEMAIADHLGNIARARQEVQD